MTVDFHDDLGETYLASLGPSEPPVLLKEASWKESSDLLDRDFALIIVDSEGREHRKYACHDPGNIAMSLWYLENADHGLPEIAVKVASHNLMKAGGLGYRRDWVDYPGDNLVLNDDEKRYVLDERRVFVKDAAKAPVPGQMSQSIARSQISTQSPVNSPFIPPSQPTVGSQPMAKSAEATSPFDMLRNAQTNWDDLDPFDRHDYSVALQQFEKDGSGIVVPDHIREYGGETLNPYFETIMHRRLDHTGDPELRAGYERLAKVASAMNPDDVVEILYALDQSASLTPRYGKNIPDPVLTVYGQEKQAMWSWIHGGDMVNERQLLDYSNYSYNWERLRDVFVNDVVEKFRKDPIGTFKAMPLEQQVLLARLATQGRYSSDGGA